MRRRRSSKSLTRPSPRTSGRPPVRAARRSHLVSVEVSEEDFMADVAWTIYTAPAEQITADLLRSFLAEQRRNRLFLESLTLELKRQRDRHNVLTAIAGMANTAGGIVLLGVDEDEPGFDESPGVTADEVTSVLGQCQSGLS